MAKAVTVAPIGVTYSPNLATYDLNHLDLADTGHSSEDDDRFASANHNGRGGKSDLSSARNRAKSWHSGQ